jgi:Small metal-binding protein
LGQGVIRRATDAEAALQHAQAAEKAKDNPHTKQGITHLNAAIDHGKQGHADVATGHGQEATPMAALFVSMASRAVSGSRGHPPLVAARGLEPPGVAHVRMQSRYKQTGCCSVRRYAKGHQNCSLRTWNGKRQPNLSLPIPSALSLRVPRLLVSPRPASPSSLASAKRRCANISGSS